ncbi:MAG: methylated-DNA--[protein]-cysteine S-methyltransferase, partial [Alphaproteobacteria bacterium]|nr:methylated-DNA--[protein]-cysteine S-methyltransferase [Alphaproteobacteria bacterium]
AAPLFTPKEGALLEAVAQIEAYFAGERISFDLSLRPAQSPRGAALRDGIIAVPYGSTATYGEVARRTDSGPRAVGQACRMNPFPIIVPCHRIVSASGPEHYSGADGIKTKAWLNAHELKHRST